MEQRMASDRGAGHAAGAVSGTEGARIVGGVLVGLALVLIWARRSAPFEDPWGAFALSLVLLAAVGVLCGLALRESEREPVSRWRPALYVFGALLAPVALFQLLAWIDPDPNVAFNRIWIFGACAALAVLGWARLEARFALFLASVYAVASWASLWDWIADGIGRDGLRWVLVFAAAALVAAAASLAQRERGSRDAGDLLTGAGIALVVGAGLVSLGATLDTLVLGLGTGTVVAESSLFWDLILVAGSLALIYAGSAGRPRGPAVVGAIGLLLFVVVVGFETAATPDERGGSLLGWPVVLLVTGALLLAQGLRGAGPRRTERRRARSAPPQPAPPPARGGPPPA
jgi:hypothetical protein